MSAFIFFAGSIAFGILQGVVFVVLWRSIVPAGAARRMMAEFTRTMRAMLAADELGTILRSYRTLATRVGAFVLRNLVGLTVALLPLALSAALLAPPLLDTWDRQATAVEVIPAAGASVLEKAGAAGTGRLAACWTMAYCATFRLLGFTVREVEPPVIDGPDYVVRRASHDDLNFLWPFVNDLEFAFFGAYLAAMCISFSVAGRRS